MARVASLDLRTEVAAKSRVAGVVEFMKTWGEILPLAVLALALRFWGLTWGLPYTLHPDEPVVFNTVAGMLQRHSLNPQTFTYPSALYYFFFAIGSVYQLVHGTTVGMALSTTGVGAMAGAGQYTSPGAVLWMRIGVALVCSAAILLVYFAARLLVGRWPAAVGAGLLAVSALHINLSQIATTDGPAATAMALVALLSIVAVRTERVWAFWLAWIAVGLATGVKYNAGTSAIMPLVAYGIVVARHLQAGRRLTLEDILTDRRFLGFVFALMAFLVTTPYAIRDSHEFLHDVKGVVLHYTIVGQLGQSGSSLADTLQDMFSWPELLIGGLAVLGTVSAVLRRRWEVLIIVSGAVVYFLIVATPKIFFLRNLAPLWPLLAILAAEGVAWLAILLGQLLTQSRVPSLRLLNRPSVRIALLGVVVAVGLIPMVGKTVQFDSYRSSVDVRVVASQWITAHIPAGASIADEAYGATLDPQRYVITFEGTGLYLHPLAWYPEHGVQYVVASDIFFGRYFSHGSPYLAAQQYYTTLISHWGTVLHVFVGPDVVGGNYGAHIYVIKAPPPPPPAAP